MSDIASWLRATIEGDKADALNVSDGPYKPETWTAAQYTDGNRGWEVAGQLSHVVGGAFEKDAAHMARHDPRDTVARCDAELAILDRYDELLARGQTNVMDEDRIWLAQGFVCLLASGYRNRDGWKDAWAV